LGLIVAQYGGIREEVLQFLESAGTVSIPAKGHHMLSQVVKWFRNLAVILNKATVKVAKSQERLYSSHGMRPTPVDDSGDLFWIHFDSFRGDDKA